MTGNVDVSNYMFYGTMKLVGGRSTSVAEMQVLDITYAKIDEVDSPGYFTRKSA